MAADFLILGRIILSVISVTTILLVIRGRTKERIGNQFLVIMILFWVGVLTVAIKPDIIDSVLNITGLVNRAQFLLTVSVAIIVYLLAYQTRKGKAISENLSATIRKIALDYFKRQVNPQNVHVSIIVLARNEEKTIGNVIQRIKNQKLPSLHNIIVVNDGSSDQTEKIAKKEGAYVVNHYLNLGVGGANKTGYLAASIFEPKIAVTIDGDGQHDPSFIPRLVEKIEDGYDMVYGSRFSDQSSYKTSSIRLAGNKFYTNLANKLGKISITDVTSGYRAIRADKIESIYFNAETNFAIELALRAAKNGLKITEIPTKGDIRTHGQSQLHRIEKLLVYNFNALVQIFNAYFRKPDIPRI